MTATKRAISDAVLAILSEGTCDGFRFCLPAKQLDRSLYTATNKVLETLGGSWSRSAKAHVFNTQTAPLIENAIETGEYAVPSDMGWFPTPRALARRVVNMAAITTGMDVLEPSAGMGAIAEVVLDRGGVPHCVEIDEDRARHLTRNLSDELVTCCDFLQFSSDMRFDRVVMNPPFAKRADIHHVLHARKFLKPDGLLVAIMSGGILFREDALTRDFRKQCKTFEALPDDSFKASGTNVRTCVITMGAE